MIGSGRREEPLRKALELGVIDRYELDLGRAVAVADMVVVAAPLGAMGAVFAAIAGRLPPDGVLTDVGSAKGSREQLLAMIDLFCRDLKRLAEAIDQGDSGAIMTVFQRAKHARDNLYRE